MTDICNTDDIIDSRDVIATIDEIGARIAAQEEGGECVPDDQLHLYAKLIELRNEASCYAADWEFGEVLIRDDHFQHYVEDLARELGLVDNLQWPATCIDWERAAKEAQIDYTPVTFDGATYWIR